MKIRYAYRWNHTEAVYGHQPYLRFSAKAKDDDVVQMELLEKNLLSAIHTDFLENRYGHVDLVLSNVALVEGGGQDFYEWEGQGFTHHITRQRVRFEHSVFGECPEWPIWCCTLAQYKAALEGYRRFLDMPESIESELIIELPDGEPENC